MAAKQISRPVITLTTDFGVADHYVGVMKGVIAGLCPDAQVVDISHDVPPFEISQGAYLVAQTWPYFPKGTVHVAVVDPGVGSSRRPILVEAHGQRFIGPDNGVLALVYAEADHKAREITNEKLFLPGVSRTFHGRDIFAPVAARIAAGTRPSSVGPIIQDHLRLSAYKPSRTSKRLWTGSILYVDRFGNLITNFHETEFADVKTRPFEVSIGTAKIHHLALTFADAKPGETVLVLGSSGYFEIAANQESAAKMLGCGVGAPVDVELF